jgi:hypothetical protein
MATSYDPQGRRVPRYRYTEKAANGLHTTALDLARFLAAWMPGPQGEQAGRSVLSPATIEHMLNERVEITGFEGWVYAESYGLGCFIETASNGMPILSHMGGYLGWRSNIALIPGMGEGIIILSNSDLGHELFADVLNAWSSWLGISQLRVARAIATARKVVGLAAGGVALYCLGSTLWKAMELQTHQRQISLGSGKPLPHRRRLAALVTLAGLPLFRRFAWPALQADLPSTAAWVGMAAIALELAALTAILTEKKTGRQAG